MTDCLSPQLAMRPFSRRPAARPAAWPGLAVPAGHSFEPPLCLAPALLGFEPQLRPKAGEEVVLSGGLQGDTPLKLFLLMCIF